MNTIEYKNNSNEVVAVAQYATAEDLKPKLFIVEVSNGEKWNPADNWRASEYCVVWAVTSEQACSLAVYEMSKIYEWEKYEADRVIQVVQKDLGFVCSFCGDR